MSVTEIENYRELILENIEYDCLKQRYPLYLDDLNEIVELFGRNGLCQTKDHPDLWRGLSSRDCTLPLFVSWTALTSSLSWTVLQKNTTQVRNIKQYLLAVLFNAPTTMNNHYTSLVNHDMHAGGW